jgi:hypothetical protein
LGRIGIKTVPSCFSNSEKFNLPGKFNPLHRYANVFQFSQTALNLVFLYDGSREIKTVDKVETA